MKQEKELHEGHRERMRKRAINEGLTGFEPYQLLELLLFYGIPRVDTNQIAHKLIDTFGSFSRVLDAPIEELRRVSGIGENAAILLKLLPQFCEQYYLDRVEVSSPEKTQTLESLANLAMARLCGETNERVLIICLDIGGHILYFGDLVEGSRDEVSIGVRVVAETALRYRASHVVLVHNHPCHIATPSHQDQTQTYAIYRALEGISINLLDHIVISNGEYFSMRSSGMLSPYIMENYRSSELYRKFEPDQPDGKGKRWNLAQYLNQKKEESEEKDKDGSV